MNTPQPNHRPDTTTPSLATVQQMQRLQDLKEQMLELHSQLETMRLMLRLKRPLGG
jgi:hypothetical protein